MHSCSFLYHQTTMCCSSVNPIISFIKCQNDFTPKSMHFLLCFVYSKSFKQEQFLSHSVTSQVLNNPALSFLRRIGKASYMKTLMKKLTSQAQTSLLSVISKITPKLNSKRFYISNVIFMKDVD